MGEYLKPLEMLTARSGFLKEPLLAFGKNLLFKEGSSETHFVPARYIKLASQRTFCEFFETLKISFKQKGFLKNPNGLFV